MDMLLLENKINLLNKQKDVVILHINHCMKNSFYFTNKLKEIFLDVVFVAVPYNNRDIETNLDYICYHAKKDKQNYVIMRNKKEIRTDNTDFRNVTYELIKEAIKNEILEYAEKNKKIIIIEDGGYHYDFIKEFLILYPILKTSIIGAIEQTTMGTKNSYKNMDYPVLSVARSLYKMRIESYFVANVILDELTRMLKKIDKFVDFHDIYIIGYGVIGRSISKQLKKYNTNVHVYDKDKNILKIAKDEGAIIETEKINFKNSAIVFGCTGEPAFTKTMLKSFEEGNAEKIFLVSASSKQIEFSDVFSTLESYKKTSFSGISQYFLKNGKKLILLAEGYPINFYNKNRDSLTFGMIDPVFTEMLLLAIYLCESKIKPENKTYILNNDSLIDNFVSEVDLIDIWKQKYNLNFDTDTFNIHPLENFLKIPEI